MIQLTRKDALVIVDMQNDFLPGGTLAVRAGNEVIPIMNRYIELFARKNLAIYATRDWHPPDHCSFKSQGGPWPDHCIEGTTGADFASDLRLPQSAIIISKAAIRALDAYSQFEGTDLARQLRDRGTERLFIGGIATDYCVLNTVTDGLSYGFSVMLLNDAIRASNVHPEDGPTAIAEMIRRGARTITLPNIKA